VKVDDPTAPIAGLSEFHVDEQCHFKASDGAATQGIAHQALFIQVTEYVGISNAREESGLP
jgi:hypothetical protein